MTGTYDFYVFDLDGTLVDVDDSYVRTCFDLVGTRLEYEFSDRQATRLWHGLGGPRNDLLRTWGLEPARFWRVYHEVEDSKARAEATYLHPDAEIVGDVDEPSVLVTHCQQYLTEPVLEALNITNWFDSVVCCTEETGWKPDPEPIRQALTEADVDFERGSGVLVGDGPHDIGAARNAGLDGAHVERHDPADRGLCVVGDYSLERVDDLFRT